MNVESANQPDQNTHHANRTPPAGVWFAAGAIAMTILATISGAKSRHLEVALLAGVLNLVLLLGLIRGYKWAYVLAILGALVGVLVAFSKSGTHGLSILLGNAIVVIPLLMNTEYYFPGKPTGDPLPPNSTDHSKQGNVS